MGSRGGKTKVLHCRSSTWRRKTCRSLPGRASQSEVAKKRTRSGPGEQRPGQHDGRRVGRPSCARMRRRTTSPSRAHGRPVLSCGGRDPGRSLCLCGRASCGCCPCGGRPAVGRRSRGRLACLRSSTTHRSRTWTASRPSGRARANEIVPCECARMSCCLWVCLRRAREGGPGCGLGVEGDSSPSSLLTAISTRVPSNVPSKLLGSNHDGQLPSVGPGCVQEDGRHPDLDRQPAQLDAHDAGRTQGPGSLLRGHDQDPR